MRVIILAAGQGTRLSPLTNKIPKCMVRLNGIPIINRQIKILSDLNIKDITIVGGYLSSKIDSTHCELIRNKNYSTTNMVASLFCASKYFDSKDDIIITYGDIVYEKKVIESLLASDSSISLTSDSNWEEYWRLRMDDPLKDAESFKVDKFNNIFEIGKKPTSYNDIEGQYMGIIRIKSEFTSKVFNFYNSLDRNKMYDGQTFDNMYMTTFIQKLIDHGFNVNSVFVENGWLEIDTIKDLEIYKNLEREDKLSNFCNIK